MFEVYREELRAVNISPFFTKWYFLPRSNIQDTGAWNSFFFNEEMDACLKPRAPLAR